MSRYNHFAPPKYKSISFADVSIGQKFRNDLWAGKRARRDIVCIKTGELEYTEQGNGNVHTSISNAFPVYSYDVLNVPLVN